MRNLKQFFKCKTSVQQNNRDFQQKARMAVDIPGLVSIILFYIIILIIGIWAARKSRVATDLSTEDVWLANRSLGAFVGIFTMTGKITVLFVVGKAR